MGAKRTAKVSCLDLFRFAQAENCTMQEARERFAAHAEAKARVEAMARHREAMARLFARMRGHSHAR